MKYTESEYINNGYRYERSQNFAKSKALSDQLKEMINSEEILDRKEALRLFEIGRREAQNFIK